MRRRTEPAHGLIDHERAMRARNRRGAIRRSVVDDDRPIAVGKSAQNPGESFGLVETGEDDVDAGGCHGARVHVSTLGDTVEMPR